MKTEYRGRAKKGKGGGGWCELVGSFMYFLRVGQLVYSVLGKYPKGKYKGQKKHFFNFDGFRIVKNNFELVIKNDLSKLLQFTTNITLKSELENGVELVTFKKNGGGG